MEKRQTEEKPEYEYVPPPENWDEWEE